MAHELLSNCPNISNRFYIEPPYRNAGKKQCMNWVGMSNDHQYRRRRRSKYAGHCSTVKTRFLERKSRGFCTSSSSPAASTEEVRLVDEDIDSKRESEEYVVIGKQEGWNWNVRKMAENDDEMRKVAQIQAEAFHVPVALFNDFFFQFFQAEVLAGLLYRLRNSPPDRYACLVAETSSETADYESPKEIVGVVDITVLRDDSILQHLRGSPEYLYVSGIAVLNNFRRRKVATALLKACDMLSITWGFEYLVLRAYEDDLGARKLYTNAGYNVVSGDPPWMTTWIGRKRRILLIKRV